MEALEKHTIKCVLVPTGYNGELQPLDLAFNDPFKQEMKDCFTRWYASIVKDDLEHGKHVTEIKPDIRTSTVKPINAQWLIEVLSKLEKDFIEIPVNICQSCIVSANNNGC